MKAAQISEYGDPSVVKVVDVDKPTVAAGQVLVEVYASSLNPFDTAVRAGYVQSMIPSLPITLGGDIAGLVNEVGEGVENVKPGDKIYGQANAVAGNSGALAEFATTKADQVATLPEGLDFVQAASLPLIGVSALQALQDHIQLKEGQKILIHGGTGGIGSIAIELAKHLGAYVAATVEANDVQVAKDLGADEVIDYTSQKFEEIIKDYDAVFNTAGGDNFDRSLGVIKPGGIIVDMSGQIDEAKAKEHGITAIGQFTQVTTARLDALKELVEKGVIRVRIGKTFDLDQISDAFTARESGNIQGKIAIKIK